MCIMDTSFNELDKKTMKELYTPVFKNGEYRMTLTKHVTEKCQVMVLNSVIKDGKCVKHPLYTPVKFY